ncbi:MAG TPA: hypothetical protein VFH55_03120 [Nitrospiria bacterium]|nr:hypothetical protein [Nitrospiria bacterium]
MRLDTLIPAGIFCFVLACPSPAPAIIADRIMAIVNNEVIALSDVQKYREVFVEKRDADDTTALNDLIDQKLLLAEAKKLEIPPPSAEEVDRAYKKLQLRFGRPETFELLKARLSLTDAEIEQQLSKQLTVDKLIEQRIQFFVFVTPEEIDHYLQDHSEAYKGENLEESRKAIQDLLIGEKGDLKLKDYLNRLRARANIRINKPLPE